jgi:hypothetical protein
MMYILRNSLDRILLVVAFVAGGLVPGFVVQYRQRLGGRLDQALTDLAPWREIANQRYGGDLDALIQYHLASRDPTFHAEGAAIQSLVDSVDHLKAAVVALQRDLVHQLAYLALHLDTDLARATLHDWVPTFSLSTEGIVFALLFALALWLLFQCIWSVLTMITAKLRSHGSGRPPAVTRAPRGA